MKKKKGISAVVATVLIILITVAAVTIIWAAIIPLISNQLEEGTACLDATQGLSIVNKGYTCKNASTVTSTGSTIPGFVSLQVKHGSKDLNLKDIQVAVTTGGTSQTLSLRTLGLIPLPRINAEKVFKLVEDPTKWNAKDVDKIAIAAVIGVGNTERTCDTSAAVELVACN